MSTIDFIHNMNYEIRLVDDSSEVTSQIRLIREWNGNICNFNLINEGCEAVQVKEVVVFKGILPFEEDTELYGEGYQMLGQYGGTLENPMDIGDLSDRAHYKMPQAPGFWTVYNLAILSPKETAQVLMAFSSCNRFSGEFRFGKGVIEIVMDTEGLYIEPGQQWALEEFFITSGFDREKLLDQLAKRIEVYHPRLKVRETPTGWCSWYCYGPNITEKDIFDNINVMAQRLPQLKYVQIDDGYQAYMGDWLSIASSFTNDMKSLCTRIKKEGFEPAIWVAPFIAERDSEIFQSHPEWFVMDKEGNPLPSDRVSFGGWRRGPWYMLDGTRPEVQNYLTYVFRTMREEWCCRYFKLDANTWGALHGGYYYNKSATRIESYRSGMQAILKGAGEDSYILGCNAPMWPSLGTVHGMRVTNDISRKWDRFTRVAQQLFYRNWQNNRLWINDPDCLLLENLSSEVMGPDGQKRCINKSSVSESEFIFHASVILASGGVILSGDNLTQISETSKRLMEKLLPPINKSARFDDTSFCIGRTNLEDKQLIFLFNWEDHPISLELTLSEVCHLQDFWTGEDLGIHDHHITIKDINPHSSKVLINSPKSVCCEK